VAPGFRIRKSGCHNAGNLFAAMPQNFSWWRTAFHITVFKMQVIAVIEYFRFHEMPLKRLRSLSFALA
jgi:hypothetical protein